MFSWSFFFLWSWKLNARHFLFLSFTENAAEKELWREDTDYKDPGEFLLFDFVSHIWL